MKSLPPPTPKPTMPRKQALLADRQVKRWIERLMKDPDANVHNVDEATLRFVIEEVMKRRREWFERMEVHMAL